MNERDDPQRHVDAKPRFRLRRASVYAFVAVVVLSVASLLFRPSRDGKSLYVANRGSHKVHGARKGISVPPALAEQVTGLWRAIATGEVQIPGMTPTSRDGVGGVKFSDQDEDSTDGRPSIFHGRLSKVF